MVPLLSRVGSHYRLPYSLPLPFRVMVSSYRWEYSALSDSECLHLSIILCTSLYLTIPHYTSLYLTILHYTSLYLLYYLTLCGPSVLYKTLLSLYNTLPYCTTLGYGTSTHRPQPWILESQFYTDPTLLAWQTGASLYFQDLPQPWRWSASLPPPHAWVRRFTQSCS